MCPEWVSDKDDDDGGGMMGANILSPAFSKDTFIQTTITRETRCLPP
jgi:hypothetical protein